ncbi:hypothetical protein [Alkalibacterium olivapovliticus]|uniref:Uncharacterized protein n=1 Tax=Alkalibacterium olivapovliticus TaxID=99907 RepID=A0A2T0W5V8_9LACT|nr:hypothetical protein [Alkalibacterium olivapovliticus]PRY81459.1 hypothetical protein CLV38_11750 [Alkalibacterium olivapovliticus]
MKTIIQVLSVILALVGLYLAIMMFTSWLKVVSIQYIGDFFTVY